MPRKKKIEIKEEQAREEPLAFVAVDIETTGLNWDRDQIIELGAAKVEQGKVTARFQTLVYTDRKVPRFVQDLTGISQEEIDQAPSLESGIEGLREFACELPMIFHNAQFDLAFLKKAMDIENPCWDTLTLARALLPDQKSHSLKNLCRDFGIDPGKSHRADDDANSTAMLFIQLYEKLSELDLPLLQKMSHLALPFHRLLLERAVVGKKVAGNIEVPEKIAEKIPEGYSSIRVDSLEEIFNQDGKLTEILGDSYEFRQEQADMASSVMSAFENDEFLCAEAGTGTGKSLAYLAPAVIWSRLNNERVVISTHTKTLQEQLYGKDVPIMRSAAGFFKATVLKGRNNYLCWRRWQEVMLHPALFLTPEEREEALILCLWADRTAVGDVSEHRGFSVGRAPGLWGKICSDHTACHNNRCKFVKKCFMVQARKKAEEADVVIVNHSLLFTDLAAPNAILPDYQRVVIDEAHNIEKTATDLLGYSLDRWTVARFLAGIFARNPVESGLLPTLNHWLSKSGLNKEVAGSIEKASLDMVQTILETGKAADRFFKRKWDLGDSKGRLEKKRYLEGDGFQQTVIDQSQELMNLLDRLTDSLSLLNQWLADVEAGDADELDTLRQELYGRSLEARNLSNTLGKLAAADEKGYIFWMEPGDNNYGVKLVAGPLDVGQVLAKILYPRTKTAVFTSATLAVDGKFDFFKNRVGLSLMDQDRVISLALPSPFDFQKQAAVFVPTYLPSPKLPDYDQAFTDMVREVLESTKVGTLVLFTAFDQLKRSYQQIQESGKLNILAQWIDGNPAQLVERSIAEKDTIIFGTNSFWEGVDLPGQACELLVIARLPFSVPSDPLVNARCQAIEQAGGSSFHQYLLPEAVIRFRQGFGRLIRSRNDFGAVIVGDSRITGTEYGKVFLRSLPKMPLYVCRDIDELLENL
jgi:ATP-dependent DNA helicase DinG